MQKELEGTDRIGQKKRKFITLIDTQQPILSSPDSPCNGYLCKPFLSQATVSVKSYMSQPEWVNVATVGDRGGGVGEVA